MERALGKFLELTLLFLDLGGNYTGIHFTKIDRALLCMCVFFSNIALEKYKVEEGKGRKRRESGERGGGGRRRRNGSSVQCDSR